MSIIEIKELLATCLQQLNSREIQYELFSFTLRKLRKLSVLDLDYHCLDLITQLKRSFERFFSPADRFLYLCQMRSFYCLQSSVIV